MHNRFIRITSLFTLILSLVLISAGCNFSDRNATATPGQNATQSFLTAVARVTQFYEQTVSAAEGTILPTETEVGTPTATPGLGTPSATPAPPTTAPTGTPPPCDKASAGNPIDVTIPDGTEMLPGQTFVKTWRLVNTGTCTWTSAYAVVWASGDELGDQNVVALAGGVAPGQSVDLSVPMTAPTAPGSYQSNWRLRNADGVLFGIGPNGDAVFWVRIDVVNPTATATATVTQTGTPSPTPSITPTPAVHVNGTVNLALNDVIDFDTLQVNGGGGNDLLYAADEGGNHLLTPTGGAMLGVFGATKPGLVQCQGASLGSAALAVESVGVGTFLCYRTDAGRVGYFQVSSFDPDTGALVLIAVTWANP